MKKSSKKKTERSRRHGLFVTLAASLASCGDRAPPSHWPEPPPPTLAQPLGEPQERGMSPSEAALEGQTETAPAPSPSSGATASDVADAAGGGPGAVQTEDAGDTEPADVPPPGSTAPPR